MKAPWLALAGMAIVAGGLWLVLRPTPAIVSTAPPAQQSPVLIAAASTPAASAIEPATTKALSTCPHQQIDISPTAKTGHVERTCVGTTRTSQTGSVRRYVLAAERPSIWSLTLDTNGGAVIAAKLEGERQATFRCVSSQCHGFAIGRPDRQGARTITIADALLQADAQASASGVLLQANLKTVPDSQSPTLACTMPAVTIVEHDGALTEFCPMGGTGFEVDEAGRYRYVFRNLEDEVIAIVLTGEGALVGVSYRGMACRGTNCGGVTTSSTAAPSAETDARSFDFSGAFLADPKRPGASATLNGRLVMPADS